MKVDEYIRSTQGKEFTRKDFQKNTGLKYHEAYYVLQKYAAYGFLSFRNVGKDTLYTFVTFDEVEAAQDKVSPEDFLKTVQGEFTTADFCEHTGYIFAYGHLLKLVDAGVLNMRKEGKYCWFSLAGEGEARPDLNLRGASKAVKSNERTKLIRNFLEKVEGSFTSRQFADATGIAPTGATAYLKSLVDKGEVEHYKVTSRSYYRKLDKE